MYVYIQRIYSYRYTRGLPLQMPWALHLRHRIRNCYSAKATWFTLVSIGQDFVDFMKRQDTYCHHIQMFLHTACSSKGRKDTYDISIQIVINLQDAAANRPHEEKWKKLKKKKQKLNTERRESGNEEKRRKTRGKLYLTQQWIYKAFYMTLWSSMCKTGFSKCSIYILVYTTTHFTSYANEPHLFSLTQHKFMLVQWDLHNLHLKTW